MAFLVLGIGTLTACSSTDPSVEDGHVVRMPIVLAIPANNAELTIGSTGAKATRAEGDPGTYEQFKLPTHLYIYLLNTSIDGSETNVLKPEGMDDKNGYTLKTDKWTKTTTQDNNKDSIYTYTDQIRIIIPENRSEGVVYAAMSTVPITVTYTGTTVDEATFTLGTEASGKESEALKNLYSSPCNLTKDSKYYGIVNDYKSNSPYINMVLYHVASKLDVQWNVDATVQSSVKLIERGKNSLCEPPKLGGALDERGSRITPEGIVDDDEPDSLEIMTREKKEYTQDEIDAAFLVKDVFLRQELNEPWPRVLHAPIPFDGGGMLDGYYYPNSKYGGTIMVSKEIATPGFNSPNNFTFCSYELAIATQTPFPYDNDGNVVRPESVKKYQRLHKLLSDVGHYVENTSHFNRYDSIGLAPDHSDPDLRNAAFVADAVCLSNTLAQDAPMVRLEKLSAAARMEYEEIYPGLLEKLAKRRVPTSFFEDRQFFGVMIIIEVYQSELQAMLRKELTREEFIGRLKEAGYWPFSDLDLRPPLL